MFTHQPIVSSVSSLSRQHFNADSNQSQQPAASSASVAAARRRFAASTVYDSSSPYSNDDTDSVSGYDNYTKTSARSSTDTKQVINTFDNQSITVATPRAITVSNATRLRARGIEGGRSIVASGAASPGVANTTLKSFANATFKSNIPSTVLSSRDSTQNLYGSSSSPTRWTTNLYREFRPNTINRCVDAFEKSLTTLSVETRLHALRSLYHNACDGAAHRRAIRQRLPKLVGAVAAICNETDPSRPGGNRLHDIAFKLIAALVGDGERTLHEEASSGLAVNREDVIEGERFDNTAALEEGLMSVAAPRALLAGGDATFAVATCLRRMSELPSIAHAIVHNDVLLESILRVLEEESIWHLEVNNGSAPTSQQQQNESSFQPKRSQSSSTRQTSIPNSRSTSAAQQYQSASSPNSTNQQQQQQQQNQRPVMMSMSLEGAAAVIQLRIALLNICSRPSAATFILSRSQRFMNLMHRDAKMGVLASQDLSLQLAEQQQQQQQQQQSQDQSSSNFALADTLLLNADQRYLVKSFNIGGALLEEKPAADLANGKRLLFLPSHVVCFALTGSIFDSKAASTEALTSLPAHPSIPSEGGAAIPFSRASHRAHQPLQCRLEASRVVRGDELSLLAATSAVFALHTLHSIALRENNNNNSNNSNSSSSGSSIYHRQSQQSQQEQKELVKFLTLLILGNQQQQLSPSKSVRNSNGKQSASSTSGISDNNNNHKVSAQAIEVVLAHLKSAAAAALDVFEEADNENVLRKLENFSSEGRAMLDKLRSNLYHHQNQNQE